jgi:hypothetical protein
VVPAETGSAVEQQVVKFPLEERRGFVTRKTVVLIDTHQKARRPEQIVNRSHRWRAELSFRSFRRSGQLPAGDSPQRQESAPIVKDNPCLGRRRLEHDFSIETSQKRKTTECGFAIGYRLNPESVVVSQRNSADERDAILADAMDKPTARVQLFETLVQASESVETRIRERTVNQPFVRTTSGGKRSKRSGYTRAVDGQNICAGSHESGCGD